MPPPITTTSAVLMIRDSPPLALHGLALGLADRQRRQFAQRDRLHRRTQAIVAHLVRPRAALFGDQLRHREAAEPALAGPHAATQESLHLVGALAAHARGLADLLRGHFLTSADDRIAFGLAQRCYRPIELVEESATHLLALQPLLRGLRIGDL